jgi:CubicO group peptidase (beta-lactamase class C family)
MCNIEKSTKLLEQQSPWWEPGTATGYHGWTMGHLVGELVRRVTGKPIQEFIAEELARPLAADFQLGIPEREWNRVADIIPPPMPAKQEMQAFALDPNNLMFKSLGRNPGMDADWANQPLLRNSAIAAGNGYSNARGLVRLLSVVSLENRSFLAAKTIDQIFSTQQEHKDLVIPAKVRFGLGFGLPAEGSMMANLPQGRVTSWGGWGGSQVVADADRKLTIGYVMNKMEAAGLGQQEGGKGGMGNTRTKAFIAAVYEAFGIES